MTVGRVGRRGVRPLAVAACLAATVGLAVSGAAPAALAAQQEECAEPGEPIQPQPWAQRMLAPVRVWPFTRGGGVTVAVLSTGVEADHPQLAGQVAGGFDAVADGGTADTDCLGAGTQVAGLIAAEQASGVGFVGLAPEVTILPVRVIESQGLRAEPVDPAVLARGIRWAAGNGAHVIDVAVAVYSDHAELRAAVDAALAAGIAVVAAAAGDEDGDEGGEAAAGDEGGETRPGEDDPTPYPAAYEGVIGVGAIDPQGAPWPGSPAGDPPSQPAGGVVDLVAPGAAMVTLQRGGGMVADVAGTHLASGVVAGAAALVRARWGDLTPDQLARRLAATAAPAPAGPAFGHGVVDPYAAVNDTLVDTGPQPLPALARPAGEPESTWVGARRVALVGAAVAAGLVVAVIVVAAALPRGRRRWWRATVAPAPPSGSEAPEPRPPVMLFD